MTREWKPGDVAHIKGDGMDTVAIRTKTGGWAWVDPRGRNPIQGASFCHQSSIRGNRTARPLVVIDPEDREQVERLTKALVEAAFKHGNQPVAHNGIHGDTTEAALRSLLTPPEPDEPTGLGAVVEDALGLRWVRTHDAFWESEDGSLLWEAMPTVARVLSEGVQPC